MKKHTFPPPKHPEQGRSTSTNSGTNAALIAILKTAYRRHARGKIACAAVAACLGR
jgi:hypothetical protein